MLYAFSVAIVPALRTMKGTQHIAVMQSINAKIENPLFFLSFFGPTLLLPWAAFLHQGERAFVPLVAASILYIVGANGVTGIGHIPLNKDLAKVDTTKVLNEEAERIRKGFQGSRHYGCAFTLFALVM